MHRGGSGHSSYASSQERRPSTTASSEVPPTMTAGGSTLSFESVEQYDYGTNSWTAYSTPHEPVAALAGTSLSGYAGCPPPPPPHGGQAPLSFSYPPHQPSHHAYGMYDHSYDYNNDVVLAAVESARWEYQTAAGLDQQQGSHIDPSFQLPPAVQPPPEPALHVEPVKTRQPRTHRRHRSDEAPSITSSGLALPAATDDSTHVEVKPFVYKIFSMLADPDRYQDVILWDHAGEAFFVAHNDRFVNEVLREQFQHTNIHSFTRQLNVYQFQRYTVAQLRSSLDLSGAIASTYSGWTHPQFKRGRPDLLPMLTPRPSRARLIRKLEKQYSKDGSLSPGKNTIKLPNSGRRGSSAGTSTSSSKAGSDTSPPVPNAYAPLPIDISSTFTPYTQDITYPQILQHQQQQNLAIAAASQGQPMQPVFSLGFSFPHAQNAQFKSESPPS